VYAHWDARLRNENATLRASLAAHHAAAAAGAAEINGPPPPPPEHVARPETPHEFRVHVPHRPLLGGGGGRSRCDRRLYCNRSGGCRCLCNSQEFHCSQCIKEGKSRKRGSTRQSFWYNPYVCYVCPHIHAVPDNCYFVWYSI
jgi:hypothetical protein